MSQRSFASAEYAIKDRTRRDKFLAEMERIVSWTRLVAVVEPSHSTSDCVDHQPIGIARMVRMCCLPQWYRLADGALEEGLYNSQPPRDFVAIDLPRKAVPDAKSIPRASGLSCASRPGRLGRASAQRSSFRATCLPRTLEQNE